MKKCNVCGFVIEDDSLNFCPSCGNAVVGDVNANAGESVNANAMLGDVGADTTSNAPKKSKKKKVLLICIPIIAVVLIVAIVASIFIFASSGPVKNIIDAAINTVEAESFTFEADVDGEKVECKVNIDFEKRDIQFFCAFEPGYYDEEIIAIYDGYFIEYGYAYDEYDGAPYEKKHKYDISAYIEAFFENWDMVKDTLNSGDIDYDKCFEIGADLFGGDESDLRDFVEEHVNLEKASDAIKEALKLLNDEAWLAENVGFEEESKDGVTYYSFDVDFDKVAKTAEDTFSDSLESSDAEDVFDEVLDELKEMDDRNYKVKAEIALEDDFVKEATVKIGRNGNYERATFKISDVGSTKIDTDKLQEYLDKCK